MASRARSVKRLKRPQPAIYGGIGSSYEDKDNDFVCPICFEMIEEAYMTKCGHSFCHKCIQLSLEQSNRCPKCNYVIESNDQLFPNFLLNELIQKRKTRLAEQKRMKLENQNDISFQDFLLDQDNMDLTSVNTLIEILKQKKNQLEGENHGVQNLILKEFLDQVRERKQEQLDQLSREIKLLEDDMSIVDTKLTDHKNQFPQLILPTEGTSYNGIGNTMTGPSTSNQSAQEGFNGSKNAGQQWLHSTMASRRKKVQQHFEDLEKVYFEMRLKDSLFQKPPRPDIQSNEANHTEAASPSPSHNSETNAEVPDPVPPSPAIFERVDAQSPNGPMIVGPRDAHSLDDFTESLAKFTKFSSFRPLATLNYASDIYNTSSIVSSIEFARDSDFFAIAGVTKKIKVFEYSTVIHDAVDIHYPVNEMVCNSKISSIVWSSYHKSMLASSDYEGTVTLWDAFNGTKSRIYQEHEKRCWSVDFNKIDPKLLASGSDDSKVKLWYTNMEHSVVSIEAKANVCCVKFNPTSRYHLTFGSADHCVHYYDLRNPKKALNMFKGHKKAVSYTKFVNGNEIVSASTDSQLKLWSLNKPYCLRTFRGHTNEKNFVGLDTDGDYVACGSENNSLYIYYKGLSKPLMTFWFDTVRSVLDKERREDDANEFVSALCWRPGSNVVLAANSQGLIKVLELV